MATYEELMAAARKADQAGDAAAAKRFLQIARGKVGEAKPQGNGVTSFMGDVNRGIASVGDAASELIFNPIDATSEFFGGPRISSTDTPFTDIFEDMGAISTPSDPGLKGRVARSVGGAAGTLLPGGAALNVVKQAPNMVGRAAGMIMDPFVKGPGRAVATELLAGAGAGAGGVAAENMTGSGHPLVRAGGEMVGGAAAALTPYAAVRAPMMFARNAPVSGRVIDKVVDAAAPYTKRGAKVKASNRVRSLVADPEEAARNIEAADPRLSPAQASGEERLMALENTVRQADAGIEGSMREQTAKIVSEIGEQVKVGDASPDAARTFFAERQGKLRDALDARIGKAEARAADRLAKVAPQRDETANSLIVREEIDAALGEATRIERDLWNAVPRDARVGTRDIYRTFDEFVASTPAAQQADIPVEARKVLDEAWVANSQEAPFPGGTDRPTEQTVAEMHGLYSKLREIARNARSGTAPQRNKARIADNLADAILRDLGAYEGDSSAVGEAINTARRFSRDVAERFEQGTVGRILGKLKDGGDAIDPSLTLARSVGRGGAQAKVSLDDIRAATGGKNADGAVKDYLRRRFDDFAGRTGEVNPQRASDFIRSNREILREYPDLVDGFREAASSQVRAAETRGAAKARMDKSENPRQSGVAAFSKAPIDREFDAILKADNPAAAASQAVRTAKRDPSGAALESLKGSASSYLIRRGVTVGADGAETLSGKAILNALSDRRTLATVRATLSKEEFTRVKKMAEALNAVERSARAGTLDDGVLPDKPAAIISFIARTFAARQGAKAGAGTSGASLLTANFASRRMQQLLQGITVNRAERLIADAVQDRDLFVALLRDVRSPEAAKKAETVLAEWFMAQGAMMAEDE